MISIVSNEKKITIKEPHVRSHHAADSSQHVKQLYANKDVKMFKTREKQINLKKTLKTRGNTENNCSQRYAPLHWLGGALANILKGHFTWIYVPIEQVKYAVLTGRGAAILLAPKQGHRASRLQPSSTFINIPNIHGIVKPFLFFFFIR